MPFCYRCGKEIPGRAHGSGRQIIFCNEHRVFPAARTTETLTWELLDAFAKAMDERQLSTTVACLAAGLGKDWYNSAVQRLHYRGHATIHKENKQKIEKWVDNGDHPE